MEEKAVIDFTGELCRYAGESEAFAEEFLKRLKGDAEIYEEFTYYITHGNFCMQSKDRRLHCGGYYGVADGPFQGKAGCG